MERGDNSMSQGGDADETEDRDHHQEQRVDRQESVPAECHYELIRFIVTKLLDNTICWRGESALALPLINSRQQFLDQLHWHGQIIRHTWVSLPVEALTAALSEDLSGSLYSRCEKGTGYIDCRFGRSESALVGMTHVGHSDTHSPPGRAGRRDLGLPGANDCSVIGTPASCYCYLLGSTPRLPPFAPCS